ncbi:MAG: tetratricopeptide repeat protein [Candidatus Thermoplasmatota archaeon]|nr:tetratricopeptide repeat protein [Candidatus Thermoplasmatota archaeon]
MNRALAVMLGTVWLLPAAAAQVVIVQPSEPSAELAIPFSIAIVAALLLWRWFVPRQLASLQVAFEIDDDLYEVHRISKTVGEARELLSERSVSRGAILYMMGMTGILLLIAELMFDPNTFYQPNLYIIALLVGLPIVISPWETLNAQLIGVGKSNVKARLASRLSRLTTLPLLLSALVGTVILGLQLEGQLTPEWIAISLLVFMGPTIIAYGRIMGASWNVLLLNKWRSFRGRTTAIDPEQPRFVNRLVAVILVLFLFTMPLTALNGIVTVIYVVSVEPANTEAMLNYGGIIGYSIYSNIDLIMEIVGQLEVLKSLPQVLSLYLSLNVAIVGLAFIFELTRNLLLGGQSFGGTFGVQLAPPRDIRSEVGVRGKLVAFCFAGFSGYTVLLLLLVCYKEFGDVMPYTDWLTAQAFDEEMRLLTTWMFIAVGQAIFMLTWLASISQFGRLRSLRFDIDPDQRRDGAVMLTEGNNLRMMIDKAAQNDDLDMLRRLQAAEFTDDEALIRHEKARAKMWELALRGLWPQASEEAKKVLAQSGGDDDESRLLLAAAYLASRRLDAAREALYGLEQPEGYDEPELISFLCEWLDPWHGRVDEDDLWDWENNSTIDHLQDIMKMLESWDPNPDTMNRHDDRLSRIGRISRVALLRAQRRHKEALELALDGVRADPTGVRPRVAVTLCLVDQGRWHEARTVLDELNASDPNDPRVKSLMALMGHHPDMDEFEVAMAIEPRAKGRNYLDEAPINPMAGALIRGGLDEALTANALIVAHEAVRRAVAPGHRISALTYLIHLGLVLPLWGMGAAYLATLRGTTVGLGAALAFGGLHVMYIRLLQQQRHVVKQRDQRMMIELGRRLKRKKAVPTDTNTPIGTHLILTGLLLTVNGVVLDIGLPAWLTARNEEVSDRSLQARLKRRAAKMERAKSPRTKPLGRGWWLKREDPTDGGPALDALIGPSAYRGRAAAEGLKQKLGGSISGGPPRRLSVSDLDMAGRGAPMNTRRSERFSGVSRPR